MSRLAKHGLICAREGPRLSTPQLEKPLASETKSPVRVCLEDVCAMLLVCLCDCPACHSCNYGGRVGPCGGAPGYRVMGEVLPNPASVRLLSFRVSLWAGKVLFVQVDGRSLGTLQMLGIPRMIGFVLRGSNGEERRRCL